MAIHLSCKQPLLMTVENCCGKVVGKIITVKKQEFSPELFEGFGGFC